VTNDKDKEKKGKIIIFPENRIKKKITQPQDSPFTKRLKEQQTREFIEGNVDEIGFDLLRKFSDMGLRTNKETFTKDLALVIDCIRGLIYRDFNMAHAAQLMANKMVSIKFNRGGKASAARIDYSDFMKKPKRPDVFNKEFKEELNDLQDGSDMFESDIDLNGDDDKK
tara:strand:- start:7 stop:510 length:504 start_codon:yes stop_codon:yes gene_type:complete